MQTVDLRKFNVSYNTGENVIVKRGDKKKLLDIYREQCEVFKKYLIQAYENDGDQKNADKLMAK